MTLQKARELLLLRINEPYNFYTGDDKLAMHLSVEALNFIILSRISSPGSVPALLHGETLEFDNISVKRPKKEGKGRRPFSKTLYDQNLGGSEPL